MPIGKKEAPKGWLHHATKESVCLIINSKEYKDKLKSGYKRLMSDVLKEIKLLKEAEASKTEGLTEIPKKVVDLSDEELGKLYDECDEELVKRGLLTSHDDEKGGDNASKEGRTLPVLGLSEGHINVTSGTFLGATTFFCVESGDLDIKYNHRDDKDTQSFVAGNIFGIKNVESITVSSGKFHIGFD